MRFRFDTSEVSGIHHSVFGGFISLKISIYSAGEGSIRLRDFSYRALGRGPPFEGEPRL